MRKPASMKGLEEFGRVRLSPNFFMREMLYSEIANFHGIGNIPSDPDLAIVAGTRLCEELLKPLRRIDSHAPPKGCLTKPGMANHSGSIPRSIPGFRH